VVLEAEGDGPAVNAELTFLDDLFARGYGTRQHCYSDWGAGPNYTKPVERCYSFTDFNRPLYLRFGGIDALPVAIPRMLRLAATFPGGAAGQFSARLEPGERRMIWDGKLAGLDYDGTLTFRTGESSGRTTAIGARLAARMVDTKLGLEFPISGDIAFHPPDAPGTSGLEGGMMDKAPGYALPFGRLSVMGFGIDRPGIVYLSQPRIRHQRLGDIAEMYYSTTGMMLKLVGHEVRAVSYLNPLERVLRHNWTALGWMNPLDGINYPFPYTQYILPPYPQPARTPCYDCAPPATPAPYESYPPYYGESPSPDPYVSYPPYYGESPWPEPYASYYPSPSP